MKSSRRQILIMSGILTMIAVAAGGCTNNNSNNSNLSGPTPNVVTETFTGSLGQGGTDVHPFTVNNSGYQLLAGFTTISPASITSLGVGVATWDPSSSTCGLNQTQNGTGAVGSTAISGTANSGPLCVRVYDGGNVTAGTTVSYTLQVQHY
ncbi:MAG TPA: hypothetical protein VFZ98_00830 [Vicinamibacterales bacterium]